jgi:hypothetical protein
VNRVGRSPSTLKKITCRGRRFREGFEIDVDAVCKRAKLDKESETNLDDEGDDQESGDPVDAY